VELGCADTAVDVHPTYTLPPLTQHRWLRRKRSKGPRWLFRLSSRPCAARCTCRH